MVAFLKKWLAQEPPARNHLAEQNFLGETISVARTGYTGEDGVEVFFPARIAAALWQSALAAGQEFGLKPAASARATPCASKCAIR